MNEKKEVDVLSKKRPTVNELKSEVIRLRKSNEKSDAGLNHYKVMYENICNEDKALRSMSSKLSAANNQLADENVHGAILQDRGILYAPDFLINAGGIINVYAELAHYDKVEIMRKTENIYNTTLEIFDFAIANKMTTHHAALTIAQNRINQRKIENSKK